MFSHQSEVLGYNDSLRLNLPLWTTFFFSVYVVWQMVITFFSTSSLCLYGKTPLPISAEHTIFIIIAGYLFSATFLYLFPKKTVSLLRILLPISLASSLLMYFPFNVFFLTSFFYIQSIICVFMIASYVGIIVPLFSPKTELKRAAFATFSLGIVGAFLHFDGINVPYEIFNTISIVCQILALISLFFIPKNINIVYLNKHTVKSPNSSSTLNFTPPKILILGFLFIGAITGLLYCFCATIAESIFNGISIMHAGGVISSLLFIFLLHKLQLSPTKIFSIFISIFFLGFVIALISINIPSLRIVACIFFGISLISGDFYTYFGILTFAKYPSKILAPGIAIFALFDIILHSILLEIFRTNLTFLYSIYGIIATLLVIVYFFIEPYFSHAIREAYEIKFLMAGKIKKTSGFETLSEQESILANYILDGYTESSISKMMNITLNTQKSYRKTLYNKLQIHSKRELFALAKNS